MKLTPQNFFTHFFILNHKDINLDEEDRNEALAYSIALGVLSLATIHITCALIRWCFAPGDKSDDVVSKTDSTGRGTLPQVREKVKEKVKENEQNREQDKPEKIEVKEEARKEEAGKEEVRLESKVEAKGIIKEKKAELQKADQKDKNRLLEIKIEVEEMSLHLSGENFAACMNLAFKHHVPNALWRGLAFVVEHIEEEGLFVKLFSKGKGWFSSEKDKQISRLIEIGRECRFKTTLSMSPRGQRCIRLECESFKLPDRGPKSLPYGQDPEGKTYLTPKGKISQDTIWNCLQKVQSLASVEELDTGMYQLSIDRGDDRISHNDDYIKFINQASSILPNLKEIKIFFDETIQIDWKENTESTGLLSFLVRSFREIEGIGIHFDYQKEQTEKYLDAFLDDALVSQTGKPIQLRSLVIDFYELTDVDVSAQDLLEQFPGLHDLEVNSSREITVFPEFPNLERLKLIICPQLRELNVSKVRHLTVILCDQLKSIEAPEAKEIHLVSAGVKELQAEKAEVLWFEGTELEEVIFPSAKMLFFVERNRSNLKKITIPEKCECFSVCTNGEGKIERKPWDDCEIIRIPKER